MEWVLDFALVWWVVVAVMILTAIVHTATKKPETQISAGKIERRI